MIEVRPDNKTLYFGYGDICVGCECFNLTFREFEPPTEKFSIPITRCEEAKQLIELLDSMDGKDNFQFDFKGWRFNFSNWNPKSVEVIKLHLNAILKLRKRVTIV